ncbi:MAG: PAS domain-containing sensor histidine kinase [Bacteroidota bacterium]
MEIDIRTIVFILGFTHLMQVLVFFHQFRINKTYNGPGWWLMWSAAEAIGFGAMLLRNIPSILPMIIIIQNSMFFAGTIFLYIGVIRFFNRKVNLKLVFGAALAFLFVFLYFLFLDDNIQVRSAIISAALAAISIITTYSLFYHKTRHIKASANFLAVIFVIHSAIFMSRCIMIIAGTRVDNIFTPTLFNFLPYFDALIVSLLWTFGFIIMLNQRLNAEMSEAKDDLRVIFNTSPDAALITRLDDGKIVEVNEGYTAISGYTREEMSGKSIPEINLWKNIADRQRVVEILKEQGYSENYEAVFVRKDGVEITGLMSAKIINLQGVPHIISITRDITARKQAEKELELKNELLIKLNAEKDKFFSIIAHDLRSPFNAFLGFTQIMAEDLHKLKLDEIQKIAMTMKISATNLYRLLENLLDWSRIQRNMTGFDPEQFLLMPKISESLQSILEPANKKEINIDYDIPEDLEVFADEYMLGSIIRNLTSNAVKFTDKGGKINIKAKPVSGNSVEISISDTGIGMNKKMIDNLFKLDEQTNRKGTQGEPSTGLGLIICKDFVEKHGGKFWLESEVAKGSIFYFTIPNKNDDIEF